MPLPLAALKQALRDGPFVFPGGYPLYFVTSDGAALSFEAVRRNLREVMRSTSTRAQDGWQVEAVEANWEDDSLYCDHTGERISSAYGED